MSGLTRSLVLGGSASGADYLGPQTMAALQAGAYANGTPGLLALAKDTVVYLTDRGQAVTPSPDGTTWTTGASGDRYTPAELAALATPLRAGTLVADPTTGIVYGQSDGAGGYSPLGGVSGSIGFSESKTATGTTATFSNGSQLTAAVTLSQSSGTLTLATVRLEKSDGTVLGVAYFPGSMPQYINLPAASLTLRCNVVTLSGASPGVLIAVN